MAGLKKRQTNVNTVMRANFGHMRELETICKPNKLLVVNFVMLLPVCRGGRGWN